MSNGLQRLGQAARKLFGVKKKVNLREVNKTVVKDTATSNSSFSRGYRPSAETPGATGNRIMQTMSPITKGYKCGRGFLSSTKYHHKHRLF